MNFYSSLVCIEVVLCLAVISTALQKLHKCVTKNTTELLLKKKKKKRKREKSCFPIQKEYVMLLQYLSIQLYNYLFKFGPKPPFNFYLNTKNAG